MFRCTKYMVVLLAAVMCGSVFGADVKADKAADKGTAKDAAAVAAVPVIEIANPVVDLGDVNPKSKHKFVYNFTNTGTAELVIDHVQPTCGCTIPALKKKNYAPGESGEIDVTFTASMRGGRVTKHLFIHSNDPAHSKLELAIKCNVVFKVKANPGKLQLNLGKEQAGVKDIELTSVDGKEFAITSVRCTGDALKCEFDPKVKAKSFKVKVTADIEKLSKNLNGAITFNLDRSDCKSVLVTYRTTPKYIVSPARVVFLNAEGGATQKRLIWIKSNYERNIQIVSAKSDRGTARLVDADGNDLDLSTLKTSEGMLKFNIVITAPEQKNKELYFRDKLHLKLANGEALTIDISGWYKKRK